MHTHAVAKNTASYEHIDPAKVGNGQGAQTNLVIALRDPDGVNSFGRMPDGGPFLQDQDIATIVAWIDAERRLVELAGKPLAEERLKDYQGERYAQLYRKRLEVIAKLL